MQFQIFGEFHTDNINYILYHELASSFIDYVLDVHYDTCISIPKLFVNRFAVIISTRF